jgi:hypothetical protein
MNCKRILLLITAVLLVGSLFSQNYNEKLLVKYTDKELSQMQKENPTQLDVLDYFVTEGYTIVDMPDKPIEYLELAKVNPKTGQVNYDYQITMADLESFNPLEFNCMFDSGKPMYYKVGDTGKLIIVESYFRLQNKAENKKRVENLNR